MVDNSSEEKARLMAAAEAAIDALLARRAPKGKRDLRDIERLARQAGLRFMEGVTAELADEEAAAEEETRCPECGQEMIYKGEKERNLVTDTGEVRITRRHYYCPTCRKGVFPPRPSVGAERHEL